MWWAPCSSTCWSTACAASTTWSCTRRASPTEYLRWIVKEDEDAPALKEEDLLLPNDAKLVEDYKGNQLLLFASQWSIQWVQDRNKNLKLAEFGGAKF